MDIHFRWRLYSKNTMTKCHQESQWRRKWNWQRQRVVLTCCLQTWLQDSPRQMESKTQVFPSLDFNFFFSTFNLYCLHFIFDRNITYVSKVQTFFMKYMFATLWDQYQYLTIFFTFMNIQLCFWFLVGFFLEVLRRMMILVPSVC